MLDEIITNKILVIPISAWALSQILKVFVSTVRRRRLDLWILARGGGMPSSHTALVCALATVVAITQGFGSVFFAITVILAMVVMYDAAGVRQAVGRQSFILNRIVKELMDKRPRGEVERDLREFIGHTPFQVIIGAALGIFIAWLWLALSGV
ncbi:MAG: divergent PAP2 family protein [Dehalococcoidia bacterium]|nr:MAG: divergent PAP2 family protein [Dehalococcoidia bacterium]